MSATLWRCECGAKYEISEAGLGGKVRCSHCGAVSRVEKPSSTKAPPLLPMDSVPSRGSSGKPPIVQGNSAMAVDRGSSKPEKQKPNQAEFDEEALKAMIEAEFDKQLPAREPSTINTEESEQPQTDTSAPEGGMSVDDFADLFANPDKPSPAKKGTKSPNESKPKTKYVKKASKKDVEEGLRQAKEGADLVLKGLKDIGFTGLTEVESDGLSSEIPDEQSWIDSLAKELEKNPSLMSAAMNRWRVRKPDEERMSAPTNEELAKLMLPMSINPQRISSSGE